MPRQEVKTKPVEAPVNLQMPRRRSASCMVNDDSTEAICCDTDACWYVDLTYHSYDPYEER